MPTTDEELDRIVLENHNKAIAVVFVINYQNRQYVNAHVIDDDENVYKSIEDRFGCIAKSMIIKIKQLKEQK